MFLTSHKQRWVRTGAKGNPIDSVAGELAKLLHKLGLKRRGLNFYALRHGFETVAGEAKDQPAVHRIMGHVDNTMAGQYRDGVSDDRLRAVVDVVSAWLSSAS